MDSFDGNKRIDLGEFTSFLTDFHVPLNKNEMQVAFEYFDKNKDNTIDFDEFLVAIRGTPNARRQAIIDLAFQKFDRDGTGYIDVNDLYGVYDVSMHP